MTTILPEWENPQIFNINRIAPKAHFIRYNSVEKAKSENTANNPFYQSLNGQWKFNWVKKPADIVNITDTVEFPNSVFQLLFDKALNYIAYKQGDQTTLHSVTERDISLLLSVI